MWWIPMGEIKGKKIGDCSVKVIAEEIHTLRVEGIQVHH